MKNADYAAEAKKRMVGKRPPRNAKPPFGRVDKTPRAGLRPKPSPTHKPGTSRPYRGGDPGRPTPTPTRNPRPKPSPTHTPGTPKPGHAPGRIPKADAAAGPSATAADTKRRHRRPRRPYARHRYAEKPDNSRTHSGPWTVNEAGSRRSRP